MKLRNITFNASKCHFILYLNTTNIDHEFRFIFFNPDYSFLACIMYCIVMYWC